MLPRFLGAAVLLAAIGACSTPPPVSTAEPRLSPVLTDPKGFTLYTFDKDGPGVSACLNECARNWPPFMAPSGAKGEGDWSVIGRADGARQWAYKGKPLYTHARDRLPGERAGDGNRGAWRVAKP